MKLTFIRNACKSEVVLSNGTVNGNLRWIRETTATVSTASFGPNKSQKFRVKPQNFFHLN